MVPQNWTEDMAPSADHQNRRYITVDGIHLPSEQYIRMNFIK